MVVQLEAFYRPVNDNSKLTVPSNCWHGIIYLLVTSEQGGKSPDTRLTPWEIFRFPQLTSGTLHCTFSNDYVIFNFEEKASGLGINANN